jgi:glycerophosphoryl diester phosphodiesterase
VDRHQFLDHRWPIPFAHRGGLEHGPENTVAAFAGAQSIGFSHLETDVHLTADGVLVAFHDDHLDRVTDGSGALADLPWSEVSAARIGGRESIPTLDELLERFPDAYFNIDPKADAAVIALASTILRHDAERRVYVAAFSDDRLRRIRSLLGPGACTAAGPREIAGVLASQKLRRNNRRDPAWWCVQAPVRHRGIEILTRPFIEAVHRLDRQVHAWIIDEPAEMHRLLDLGVDGIMTDRPSVLRSVLVERGLWA